MSVATFAQPNYPTQSGTTYPSNIDAAIATLANIASDFAPSQAGGTVTTAYQAGSLTSGAATVTNLATTSNIAAGQQVFGLGVPAGATVLSVDSATQVTLSANATSTTTSVLTFTQGGSPNMTVVLAPAIIQANGAASLTLTGATVSGSAVVSGITTAGLQIGMAVSGTGVAGLTLLSIDSASQIHLSGNATATNAANSLSFTLPNITFVGGTATGTTASGSTAITGLSSTAGISIGLGVTGAGIPSGATVTAVSASGLTLSAAATASGTVALTFIPVTPTITAPVANPRIDLVTVDLTSGAVGVVTGTEAAVPSIPALPANKYAVAAVRLTVGMAAITNAAITDLRNLLRPAASSSGGVSLAQLHAAMFQ